MSSIVVSPHFLSTQAGMNILNAGGNAIDAAIAVNAVQGVVAPETCGIGGDLFALIWIDGEKIPHCLDSSGYAGTNVAQADFSELESIPLDNPATVTVPGAVRGWEAIHNKFGKLDFNNVLGEAISISKEGFPVSKELAQSIMRHKSALSSQPSAKDFYPSGEPLKEGETLRRQDLSNTLHAISKEGSSYFYSGDLAQAIVDATKNLLTLDDLDSYQSKWTEPLSLEIYGKTGWTTPPHTQGYLTLATLKAYELLSEDTGRIEHHTLVECYRSLASDRDNITYDYQGELNSFIGTNLNYIKEKSLAVDKKSTSIFPAPKKSAGGTAYMAIKDSEGNAVSLIQSNFHGIGSTIGVSHYGFFLHNRGAGFNLIDNHPNKIFPLRKPLHTLSPTIWSKQGQLDMVIGTRGGRHQPQLLSQYILPHLLKGPSYEENMEKGRWIIDYFGERTRSKLVIEESFGEENIEELRKKKHEIEVVEPLQGSFGPISAIIKEEENNWFGIADPRVETSEASIK